jgi:hypothetical protein
MSFLDGMFPSSPDDPRYAANMALFGSMMKGDFAGGVQSYGEAMQRAKAQALQGRLAELQLRKGGLEVTDMERRLADEQATRDVLQGLARDRAQQPPQGQPQGQPPQAPAAPGSFGAMPEPMPNAAPQQAQPPQGAPQGPQGPAPARNNVWQFYQHVADTLRDRGLSAQAQNYYSLAEKFRPKFGTEPRVMTDPSTGKLAHVHPRGRRVTTHVLAVRREAEHEAAGPRRQAWSADRRERGAERAGVRQDADAGRTLSTSSQSGRHNQATQRAAVPGNGSGAGRARSGSSPVKRRPQRRLTGPGRAAARQAVEADPAGPADAAIIQRTRSRLNQLEFAGWR